MNHIWAIALFGQARFTPARFADYQIKRHKASYDTLRQFLTNSVPSPSVPLWNFIEFKNSLYFCQEPKKNSKAKKSHEQHQRIFWTIRGVTGHYPLKQGFGGQKVHPKVRRNLRHKSWTVLWGTFSVPLLLAGAEWQIMKVCCWADLDGSMEPCSFFCREKTFCVSKWQCGALLRAHCGHTSRGHAAIPLLEGLRALDAQIASDSNPTLENPSRTRKPWSAHCELQHWNFRGRKCQIHGLHFTV